MHTLRQLLGSKTPEVYAVAPGDSVIDAIRLMAEKGVGAVLVMDGARLAGIVSERDYARKVVLHGKSSADTSVRDIMTADVVTVSPHQTVAQCMQIVTDHRIRHLPVVEEGDVIGVISIGDLVKAVIEDQQVQLDELQRYIAS
jgi:CBS domain-containing protein